MNLYCCQTSSWDPLSASRARAHSHGYAFGGYFNDFYGIEAASQSLFLSGYRLSGCSVLQRVAGYVDDNCCNSIAKAHKKHRHRHRHTHRRLQMGKDTAINQRLRKWKLQEVNGPMPNLLPFFRFLPALLPPSFIWIFAFFNILNPLKMWIQAIMFM